MADKKKWALGAVLAAATGYVAGILTAPKSGKETRKDIKENVVKARAEAEKALKAVHSELEDALKAAKSTASKSGKKAKEEVEAYTEKLGTIKEKIRDILSRLRDGGVEDNELEKALDDAKKALRNAKSKEAK
jgi:gas vesicle protein